MTHGKMAKKKSTRMVETGGHDISGWPTLHSRGELTAENVGRRPRVNRAVSARDATVVDIVERNAREPEAKNLGYFLLALSCMYLRDIASLTNGGSRHKGHGAPNGYPVPSSVDETEQEKAQ